jgi:hypothetical protein
MDTCFGAAVCGTVWKSHIEIPAFAGHHIHLLAVDYHCGAWTGHDGHMETGELKIHALVDQVDMLFERCAWRQLPGTATIAGRYDKQHKKQLKKEVK